MPVCYGKSGIGHLKQFFLFLLVDAQGFLQGTFGADKRACDHATLNLY